MQEIGCLYFAACVLSGEGRRGQERAREEAEPEHGLSWGGHSAWCQGERWSRRCIAELVPPRDKEAEEGGVV